MHNFLKMGRKIVFLLWIVLLIDMRKGADLIITAVYGGYEARVHRLLCLVVHRQQEPMRSRQADRVEIWAMTGIGVGSSAHCR